MKKLIRPLVGTCLLLLVFAFLIGQGMIATAQDEQLPTTIGDINLASMDSEHFALYWNVSANGGGRVSSAHFRLSSTIGQPIIGNFDSAHFEHRAGFWQELIYRVYLPLITKN